MEIALDGLSFSCGSELQDGKYISPGIKDVVHVKKLSVLTQFGISLFTVLKQCMRSRQNHNYYPQCSDCSKKP